MRTVNARRLLTAMVVLPAVGLVSWGAPAVAEGAPGDSEAVTLTASAQGSTVSVTIRNRAGAEKMLCALYGKKRGSDPLTDGVAFSEGMGDVFTSDDGRPSFFTVTRGDSVHEFTGIAAGEYHVEWGCHGQVTPFHSWGTPEAMSTGATTQPTPVVVNSPPPLFGSLA